MGNAAAGGAIAKKLETTANKYNMKISIKQEGLGKTPLPLLTFDAMVEHARTFTSKLATTGETVPYLVHLKNYRDTLAFQLVQAKNYLNFNGVYDAMNRIIETYELLRSRLALAQAAINYPSEYAELDQIKKGKLREYYEKINDQFSRVRNAITDCAEKLRGGATCAEMTSGDFKVEEPPFLIAKLPSCGSQDSGDDSRSYCKSWTSSRDGRCVCQRCAFRSARGSVLNVQQNRTRP